MSTTTPNGIAAEIPRSDSTISLGKRKRDVSDDQPREGSIKKEDTSAGASQMSLAKTLQDVLEVLKSSEYAPSIINHPLPSTQASEEPNYKRARLAEGSSDASDIATIRLRIESGCYKNTDDLFSDIDAVSSSIVHQRPEKEGLPNGFLYTGTQNAEESFAKVSAFKKYVGDLLRDTSLSSASVKDEEDDEDGQTAEIPQDRKSVLTLFGHAPATQYGRQVFSNLQQLKRVHMGPAAVDSSVEVFTPFRDVALPNGITRSNVLPFNPPTSADSKKKASTFLESFVPASLPALKPLSQPKHTVTRGLSVNWYNPDDAEPTSSIIVTSQGNRTNYKQMKLRTGQWIRHSSRSLSSQPMSPESKRKPIDDFSGQLDSDRTLSMFRRAYGGGPSRDNSESIVPENMMDHVWWGNSGERRFNRLVAPQLMHQVSEKEMAEIAGAFEDFNEEQIMNFQQEPPPKEFRNGDDMEADEAEEIDKSTNEVLTDVTDLLETLASYQRIRNVPLASRTSSGTSEPSSGEFDTYEMLRTSLSLMIESLPPHAIARLNGDQLSDLNISSKLVVSNTDFKGTMEEDEWSSFNTALRPVSSYSANPRPTGYQSATPQNQYSQRSNYMTQPSTTRPAQNFQQPINYPGRPPSAQHSSNQQQPYQIRQAQSPSTSQRPTYPSNQYSQTGSSYGQSSTPRPLQNGYSAHFSPNGTPASQSYPPRSVNQSQNQGYGPTSPVNAYSNPMRSTSPQKPPPGYTPNPNPSQPRPVNSYATSANSSTQPRYFQQQHHPSQYAQYPQSVKSPNSPPNHSGGPPSLGSMMTSAEQAILMDRGRQQIARQKSGTPVNGNANIAPSPAPDRAASGTPTGQRQPNGTNVAGGQ